MMLMIWVRNLYFFFTQTLKVILPGLVYIDHELNVNIATNAQLPQKAEGFYYLTHCITLTTSVTL